MSPYLIAAGLLVLMALVLFWGVGAIKKAAVPDRKNTHKLQ